jgi:ElaB/YqjD/DUF883 family membrane-anchored ribosome-binding protein
MTRAVKQTSADCCRDGAFLSLGNLIMRTSAETNLETKTREQLAEELRALTKDAEALIESSGDELLQQTQELQQKLKGAMDLLGVSAENIGEKAKAGAKAADRVIRANPYAAIGVALGAGLLVGYLIKRK